MRRNAIIVASLFLIVLLFILSLLAFKFLIFGRPPGRMFAASLVNVVASPTTIAANSVNNSPNNSKFDLGPTVNTVIATIGVIIAAIIGLKGANIASVYRQRRKKVGKQEKPIIDSESKDRIDYAQEYRKNLLDDTFVTTFQILSMKRPLKVTNVYVPLRLSLEERSLEELALEAKYDPVKLPKVNQRQVHNHVRSAMEPGKAISECLNKRCVIVGDPGSGKTTLLKYFAVKCAEGKLTDLPELNLPIYIELNAFVNSGKNDLLDYASSNWYERYDIPRKEALDCIKDNLKEGHVLLLLDGLNETAIGESFEKAEASYKRVVTAIERINARASIIVSTRKADYKEDDFRQRPLLKSFTQLEVLDFRPEDIRKFVKSWFDDHLDIFRKEIAEELNDIIERNPRIQVLARNPLLLAVIAIVYEEDLELPQGRAELYKRCVDILLNKWSARRDLPRRRQFTLENKKKLLEEIAWYFHKQGQRFFARNELLQVIADFLPAVNIESEQSSQILDAIVIEHGLLKEYARSWYGFLHLTMQEFFVAQQIHQIHDQDKDKVTQLLKHCDEPWWEEVLLLHAVYSPDASSLLQKLLERGNRSGLQKDIFHTNLILAGRCIATHATVWKNQLREDIVSALFDILINTPYSLNRQQVAEILAEFGGTKVNERLLVLLSDPSIHKDIRIAIAVAMGRVGEQSLAQQLIWKLSDQDIDKDIRRHVASALGKMGEHAIASSLLLCLQKSNIDHEVRESIADTLGILGASGKLKELAPDLVQLLSKGQIDSGVRCRIALAVGKSGNLVLATSMIELLAQDSIEVSVRISIAEALGVLREQSIVHKLERLLFNQRLNQELRISIVDTLGALGECSDADKSNLIRKLQEILLRQSENPNVRGHAAIALGMLGDPSEANTMLKLLLQPDMDTSLCQSIVIALGKLVKRFTVSELHQTISSQLLTMLSSSEIDLGVRIHIANFMGFLGDRLQTFQKNELLSILLKFSVDLRVREAIVDVLGRLGEPAIANDLFRLLSNPDVELSIRGHIAYALCLLRYENAFPLVLKLLAEDKLALQIRWFIADSLGALGENARPSEMMPLLSKAEIDPSVRGRIAGVLARIVSDDESVLELAALLQSSDIADDIHRTLWMVSRRIGARIVMRGQEPEVIRWRDEFDG